MTKEEFEEKVLLHTSTAEEYEQRRLIQDIRLYGSFKELVDLISQTLHELYDRKRFGKKRITVFMESTDKIRKMIHDETVEFKFLPSVTNKDMNNIFYFLKEPERGQLLFLGVLRRLYNYQEYKHHSVRDILARADVSNPADLAFDYPSKEEISAKAIRKDADNEKSWLALIP